MKLHDFLASARLIARQAVVWKENLMAPGLVLLGHAHLQAAAAAAATAVSEAEADGRERATTPEVWTWASGEGRGRELFAPDSLKLLLSVCLDRFDPAARAT